MEFTIFGEEYFLSPNLLVELFHKLYIFFTKTKLT